MTRDHLVVVVVDIIVERGRPWWGWGQVTDRFATCSAVVYEEIT